MLGQFFTLSSHSKVTVLPPQKLDVFLHFRQLESVIDNDGRGTQRLFQSAVSAIAILCTKVAFGKSVFKAIKQTG